MRLEGAPGVQPCADRLLLAHLRLSHRLELLIRRHDLRVQRRKRPGAAHLRSRREQRLRPDAQRGASPLLLVVHRSHQLLLLWPTLVWLRVGLGDEAPFERTRRGDVVVVRRERFLRVGLLLVLRRHRLTHLGVGSTDLALEPAIEGIEVAVAEHASAILDKLIVELSGSRCACGCEFRDARPHAVGQRSQHPALLKHSKDLCTGLCSR